MSSIMGIWAKVSWLIRCSPSPYYSATWPTVIAGRLGWGKVVPCEHGSLPINWGSERGRIGKRPNIKWMFVPREGVNYEETFVKIHTFGHVLLRVAFCCPIDSRPMASYTTATTTPFRPCLTTSVFISFVIIVVTYNSVGVQSGRTTKKHLINIISWWCAVGKEHIHLCWIIARR